MKLSLTHSEVELQGMHRPYLRERRYRCELDSEREDMKRGWLGLSSLVWLRGTRRVDAALANPFFVALVNQSVSLLLLTYHVRHARRPYAEKVH